VTNVSAFSFPCSIHIANYLDTTKDYLVQTNNLQQDPNSILMVDQKIIIIGNPPYHGISNENDPVNDIIVQFFLHSAHSLSADIIIFILPTRCEKESFVNHMLSLLNNHRFKRGELIWQMVHCIQADNIFEICGRFVHQSSVIQVWERLLLTS